MNREVLTRPFTPAQIKTRPGPGGKHFRYLETSSVIERLNETGDPWSFEVIKYELLEDEVIVTGKLTLDGVVRWTSARRASRATRLAWRSPSATT